MRDKMKWEKVKQIFKTVFEFIKKVWSQMSRENKRLLIVSVAVFVFGIALGTKAGRTIERAHAEKELVEVTAQLREEGNKQVQKVQKELNKYLVTGDTKTDLPWNLVLVNNRHPMEEGYVVPKFTDLAEGYSVDSRIASAAKKMLNDAKAAGMNIIICSAYRSVERQQQVFNASIVDRLNSGMSYWEAFEDTRKSVAEPGTSEHALGLALDLISTQYTQLDEGQENTKEAKWLAENCYKYGFILRYPPNSTEITGIIYEPWHYRYVGVEDATKITELGITLEEYLEEYY